MRRRAHHLPAVCLAVACALSICLVTGPASAHHAPRLFDNRFGDHGGSYEHGHHIFFWMPDEKRFDHLKVCLWKGSGPRECERFKIRRVDAASFRPWGIEIRTARHFAMSRDPWYMRFVHAGRFISPRVGFHWR